MLVTWFDPQPTALPEIVPSPFDIPAHGVALRAIAELREHLQFPELARDGKMFGILVVEHEGRIGYLKGFSGMLGGSWFVDGYVPPVFDYDRRESFWPAGEAELAALDAAIAAATARTAPIHAKLAALDEHHRSELAALDAALQANRTQRRHARVGATADQLRALDQQSRGDGAERKRLQAQHREARQPIIDELRIADAERVALETTKTERSRSLLVAIHDTYRIANARGELRTLREIFAPNEPPGGAGDCAAPKLLAYAYRHGLRPIAFAEVWCGAKPLAGLRHDGGLYPACHGKCGPLLTHALSGLPVEELPVFGSTATAELRFVFEDDWLIVVDKPVGLLSVPGRGQALYDSVQTRLAHRTGGLAPTLAHRLDLDTSGLLIAAKDLTTYGALQRQFEERTVEKRYIAWVEGIIPGDEGSIELALRVDLDDRPRQIVDPIHGKPAHTTWRVLERTATRTRIAFTPHTGRTHQLRVHAAQGLDAPIVGDRLYAKSVVGEPRLLLHAEWIRFTHPHTGERVELASPAPF
jgi:tRNA pseudouridine32 synthase/23S rRNA pseudouridine746 synthase